MREFLRWLRDMSTVTSAVRCFEQPNFASRIMSTILQRTTGRSKIFSTDQTSASRHSRPLFQVASLSPLMRGVQFRSLSGSCGFAICAAGFCNADCGIDAACVVGVSWHVISSEAVSVADDINSDLEDYFVTLLPAIQPLVKYH